ncbi:right-handed parallel beta-helix repeat-containing protein [Metabacillus bambusae]|uniref:Right-handed parallel beta-helix repeat-containing protein n=1 Tax=Metabacillus bambusae TaxID=2795218 RepID=A0ABS3N1D2_9BACI|nr:right-handed parallel beta-helix repeat-containing protein [Metabacillus bambusae]MBO1511886.1 right-handed parallel beta-helix repeat-containing protein [Metabacillus bambusae]
MTRRNFLLNFLLWMLLFTFGYRFGNSSIKSDVLSNKSAETILPNNFPKLSHETDDTGRLSRMTIEASNTNKPIDLQGKKLIIAYWNIPYNNIKILGNGAEIVQKADYGSTTEFYGAVNITGKNVSIFDLKIDGNQWNYTKKKNQYGLNITGDNVFLSNVEIINTCSVALMINANNGKFNLVNVHDNSTSGLQMSQSSYHEFYMCHFDRNGYGFKIAFKKPNEIIKGFSGFGTAIRFRTQHVIFIGCTANDNGRDGFNVNQGSHDIKFIGCKAHRNNDGGFTIAADNDASTSHILGNGESPYKIEFDSTCEAENNWNSGLAIFQPCHSIYIKGRYYNNHRLAGHLDNKQPSFYNGIFVARGSKNVQIDAECFDDRQSTTISSVIGNSSFTVASWKSGTIENYPKVAIYGTDGTLKGYAKVIRESGDVVRLSTKGLRYSAANLSTVKIGDIITQAVQHYGVYFSPTSTGVLNVRGYGSKFYKTINTPVTATAPYGGDFKITNAITDNENYLLNGGFDIDTAIISNGWSYNGATGYAEATLVKSTVSLKLTIGGAVGNADGTLTKGIKPLLGTWASFAGWVYSNTPNTSLRIVYIKGTSFISEAKHSGDGKWEYLDVWAYIPEDATVVLPRLYTEGAGRVAYFDSLTFKTYHLKDMDRPFIT